MRSVDQSLESRVQQVNCCRQFSRNDFDRTIRPVLLSGIKGVLRKDGGQQVGLQEKEKRVWHDSSLNCSVLADKSHMIILSDYSNGWKKLAVCFQ